MNNFQCLIEGEPASCPSVVAAVQFAHNTAIKATTGYMQHELIARGPETLLTIGQTVVIIKKLVT